MNRTNRWQARFPNNDTKLRWLVKFFTNSSQKKGSGALSAHRILFSHISGSVSSFFSGRLKKTESGLKCLDYFFADGFSTAFCRARAFRESCRFIASSWFLRFSFRLMCSAIVFGARFVFIIGLRAKHFDAWFGSASIKTTTGWGAVSDIFVRTAEAR